MSILQDKQEVKKINLVGEIGKLNKTNKTNKTDNYNIDFIFTYLYYDTKFTPLLEKMGLLLSTDIISEFKDDYDVLNELYRREYCQLLGMDATQGSDTLSILETRLDALYSQLIQTEMTDVLKLLQTKKVCDGLFSKHDSFERQYRGIFPLLFSYDLLFFTHLCICSCIDSDSIPKEHLELLYLAIDKYM
jgi:hypothetical protein